MKKNKSNEIYITRIYDAPVKTVWDAWTDLDQVAKWWGPRGFSITTHSKDLRVGGSWSYTMHGPDGVDYPNHTKYYEVEKYRKLVYDHGGYEERPPLFRVTVTFTELKNKTKMDMTMSLATAEGAIEIKKFIKQANGNSTWDRLGEHLEKESSGKEKFVINRTFEVSIETLFEMWSNPVHMARWLPPTGMEMEFIRADMRPGGKSFYIMSGNGLKMHGTLEYLKMEKPNRLVYTQQFCDENERISRHPFAPVWPETMLSTIDFSVEGPEHTRVTVCWEPYGNTTPAELEAFIKERGGMTKGWTGSFEKLETVLGKNSF